MFSITEIYSDKRRLMGLGKSKAKHEVGDVLMRISSPPRPLPIEPSQAYQTAFYNKYSSALRLCVHPVIEASGRAIIHRVLSSPSRQ
ncbi:hypothetical protein J6590_078091 [Homalodisca vitripennis]|nr:hypothetical protein J6590_078091 [Homalodisca vitripennis]